MTAASKWVLNADDPATLTLARRLPAALSPADVPSERWPLGTTCRFSLAAPSDAWFDRGADQLVVFGQPLLARRELTLFGDHNVANALAAALVAVRAGADPAGIAAGLRTFRAIPHRVEPVREVDGVLWINDSKSTNITATEVAVAALDRPFVLLLGGRHKGEPYTRLAEPLKGRCRAVVAYGEAGPLVIRDLGDRLPVVPAGDFAEVLATARRLAAPGDAVLLSPACSSLDMFRDYAQRGTAFAAAVQELATKMRPGESESGQ